MAPMSSDRRTVAMVVVVANHTHGAHPAYITDKLQGSVASLMSFCTWPSTCKMRNQCQPVNAQSDTPHTPTSPQSP